MKFSAAIALAVSASLGAAQAPPACLLACANQVASSNNACGGSVGNIKCILESQGSLYTGCVNTACSDTSAAYAALQVLATNNGVSNFASATASSSAPVSSASTSDSLSTSAPAKVTSASSSHEISSTVDGEDALTSSALPTAITSAVSLDDSPLTTATGRPAVVVSSQNVTTSSAVVSSSAARNSASASHSSNGPAASTSSARIASNLGNILMTSSFGLVSALLAAALL